VSVDQRYRVSQEVEVIAVVSDLFLLFVRVLRVGAACRRVGANHLPVIVVDRLDDELRAPVRVDETPAVGDVDHAVVVCAVDRASETIA